uniref:Protein FAM131A isoform X1 n=1 Tax=Petromyzon marinus TaxID=7757 RepID=A0AAJ7WNA2_PETMA|nr:protein FAM131A isoform X1 [Petromyzon marinus]
MGCIGSRRSIVKAEALREWPHKSNGPGSGGGSSVSVPGSSAGVQGGLARGDLGSCSSETSGPSAPALSGNTSEASVEDTTQILPRVRRSRTLTGITALARSSITGLSESVRARVTKPMARGRVAHLIEWNDWDHGHVQSYHESTLYTDDPYCDTTDMVDGEREARFAEGVAQQFALSEARLRAWSSGEGDGEDGDMGDGSGEWVHIPSVHTPYHTSKDCDLERFPSSVSLSEVLQARLRRLAAARTPPVLSPESVHGVLFSPDGVALETLVCRGFADGFASVERQRLPDLAQGLLAAPECLPLQTFVRNEDGRAGFPVGTLLPSGEEEEEREDEEGELEGEEEEEEEEEEEDGRQHQLGAPWGYRNSSGAVHLPDLKAEVAPT